MAGGRVAMDGRDEAGGKAGEARTGGKAGEARTGGRLKPRLSA